MLAVGKNAAFETTFLWIWKIDDELLMGLG